MCIISCAYKAPWAHLLRCWHTHWICLCFSHYYSVMALTWSAVFTGLYCSSLNYLFILHTTTIEGMTPAIYWLQPISIHPWWSIGLLERDIARGGQPTGEWIRTVSPLDHKCLRVPAVSHRELRYYLSFYTGVLSRWKLIKCTVYKCAATMWKGWFIAISAMIKFEWWSWFGRVAVFASHSWP